MIRPLEFTLACIALVICLVPMAFTALAVWVSLGRPLMFSQTRCGQGGRPFRIMKFRSMTDKRDANGTLLPDAARQTPVSRALRRSRLDETPQLLTILKGDMAFVGPRPLMRDTIERHGDIGAKRCTVRPGFTGWAQISGNTTLSEEDKLALDLWYVAHRSTLLDLRILAETVKVLMLGERPHKGRLAKARTWLSANPVATDP